MSVLTTLSLFQTVHFQKFCNEIGHTTTHDLVSNFTDGLCGLDLLKPIHVSMDGPSVNWKFYNEIAKLREKSGLPKLINMGSCNLHAVHAALKFGAESTGWNLKKLMNGAYRLFKDSLAHREDYTSITYITLFPMNFCATQ